MRSLDEESCSIRPLLASEKTIHETGQEQHCGHDAFHSEGSVRNRKPRISSWAVHVCILMLYTILYALLYARTMADLAGQKLQLPLTAKSSMEHEIRKFPTRIVENPFVGDPRTELHDAWHDLLRNDNIQLPRADLDGLGLSSVYTKDRRSGIASLSVYHALHCLKKAREMMYKEYYHVNKDSDSMAREKKHADHCVEYIRESLMCKPDLSLVTFRWINNTAQHTNKHAYYPTNFDASPHECAKWEPLERWAAERRFDLFQVDRLDRPEPSA